VGAGKAIISTPYWHAAELLQDGRGALVPFKNPDAIAAVAIELLDNDAKRQAMRKRAYLYARKMVWNRVVQSYMRSFIQARANHAHPAQSGFSIQTGEKSATSQRPSAYAKV
jgi:glycosyltransferase involved in cell wall biosynthesis